MKQWHAKELSKITGVSVRTLHHYDQINLLKPELRQSNNYRLYSEKDLLKLQQIIALKFFGFKLSQIKLLLAQHVDVLKNFSLQAKFLQEKAENLMQASKILQRVMTDCSHHKSIPWQQIIQLIEVYDMTQQLENSWVKEILTSEELNQYAKLQSDLKKNPTDKEKLSQHWNNLMKEIANNLHQDPKSKIGINLGQKCMELVNKIYGKENANLRTRIYEKGFQQGKGLDESQLTPEAVTWLHTAIDAYWRNRIYRILDQIGNSPESEVLRLWNEVLEDIHGNEVERNAEIYEAAMHDENISKAAKQWLKKISAQS